MNLLEFINQHVEEKDEVLKSLEKWIGTELTDDLGPGYRRLLIGVNFLMQRTEFDWIFDDETPISINKRWREMHKSQNYALSYGIRISTSKSRYATLGFIHSKDNTLFRIHFSDKCLFVFEGSKTEYTFEEIILHCIDKINDIYNTTHLYASPLLLNQFINTKKIFDNYVSMCTPFKN